MKIYQSKYFLLSKILSPRWLEMIKMLHGIEDDTKFERIMDYQRIGSPNWSYFIFLVVFFIPLQKQQTDMARKQ